MESGAIKSPYIRQLLQGDTRAPMFVASICEDKSLNEKQRQAQIENLINLGYIYPGKPFEPSYEDPHTYLAIQSQADRKNLFDTKTRGRFQRDMYN